MKKAIFNPRWYWEEKFFDLEKKNLFNKVWNLVGLTSTIKNPGEYFTIQLFDTELVIHNIAGQLKAYLNVCPHRGGPLVLDKFGSGASVCKYHGWSFRDAKELTGISNLEWFNQQGDKDSCSKSLKRFELTTIGPFIFVFIGTNPIDIKSQFSDEVIDTLSSFGNLSASVSSDFKVDFNWKLNMENVKDFLHPYYVHETTFKPLLGFEQAPISLVNKLGRLPDELNSKVELKKLSFVQKGDFSISAKQRWWSKYIKITQPDFCFENIFLFPNINMFSVSGSHYVVQQYLPDTSRTFNYRLTVSFPEMLEKFETKYLLYNLLQIERNVIREDEVILDKVQKSMESGLPKEYFTHGDYENFIIEQQIFLRDKVYCE